MNEQLQFHNIVRDLEVDGSLFASQMRDIAPADRKYVIFFAARSGSSWLTSVLSATGCLGYPEEYLNPNFVRNIAKAQNSCDPVGVLQMLLRKCCTPNRVFGIGVRAVDVDLFGEDAFFNVFQRDAIFFNLYHENLVAQGISLYRAAVSPQYQSADPKEAIAEPDYDARSIRKWVRHVASTENSNIQLLEKAGYPACMLRYEDIIKDRAGIVAWFAGVLDVPLPADANVEPVQGELRKLADSWNTEAEQRFRRDAAEFVYDLERARLVRTLPDHAAASADPAYQEGYLAGAAGTPLRNPFKADPRIADRWRTGWDRGWASARWQERRALEKRPHPKSQEKVNATPTIIARLKDAGVECFLGPRETLPADTVLEPPCSLKRMTVGHGLSLGAFSYAVSGYFSAVSIGRYTSIGEEVQIGRSDHPLDYIRTSPTFYAAVPPFAVGAGFASAAEFAAWTPRRRAGKRPAQLKQTRIGNDVYVGRGALIRPGVAIGDGAVVGAYAVVTSDVPPYAIVAGNPARIVRFRVPVEFVGRLIALQWWRFAPWQLADIDIEDFSVAIPQLEQLVPTLEPYTPQPVRVGDLAAADPRDNPSAAHSTETGWAASS